MEKKSGEMKYADVIHITTSPPAERTKQDIERVTDWIRKRSPMFADLDRDIVCNVIKHCKCQIMLKDAIVVKQGEKGNSFYLVLHGKVSVFVKEVVEQPKSKLIQLLESEEEEEEPDADPEVEVEPEEIQKPKLVKKTSKQRFQKLMPMLMATRRMAMPRKAPKPKPDPRLNLGTRVAEFGDGKTFGEIALQRSDNKRAATVIADTDVVFLVVERELYNKSIKAFHARELAKIKLFIETQPLFNQWPPKLQSLVHNSMSKVKMESGKVLVKQGLPCDGLHFLVEGEVRVIVNDMMQQHQVEEGQLYNKTDSKTDRVDQHTHLGLHETLRSLCTEYVQIKRREGYVAAEKYQQKRHRNLCLSGPILGIGDTEQVLGLGTYIQTIQTETQSIFFHLSKDNLTRLLKVALTYGKLVHNQFTVQMKKEVHSKWSSRIEHFSTGVDDMSVIASLIKSLTTEDKPSKTSHQMTLEEKFFESFIEAFIENQAPLIKPLVDGSHYYKKLIQQKAQQRRNIEARGSRGRIVTHRLKPLQNDKKPRSIVMLKRAIKQHNSSDVDVIVPKHYSYANEPTFHVIERKNSLPPIQKPDSVLSHDSSDVKLWRSQSAALFAETQGHKVDDPLVKSLSVMDRPKPDFELNSEHINDKQIFKACAKKKTEEVELVEGKTLKFFGQKLRGALQQEYDKNRVEEAIIECNLLAEDVERKLLVFYAQEETSLENTSAKKLKRIEEKEGVKVKPGGKCFVERVPCRISNKSFQVSSHVHVKHHIIQKQSL